MTRYVDHHSYICMIVYGALLRSEIIKKAKRVLKQNPDNKKTPRGLYYVNLLVERDNHNSSRAVLIFNLFLVEMQG